MLCMFRYHFLISFRAFKFSFLLTAMLQAGLAQPSSFKSFNVGVWPAEKSSSVSEGGPDPKLLIFYPTLDSPAISQLGPFQLNAKTFAKPTPISNILGLIIVVPGARGSYFDHWETAMFLSKAGFVVAALEPVFDNYSNDGSLRSIKAWHQRVLEVSRGIDLITNHHTFKKLLFRKPVGGFGFSRGGFSLVALLGAQPKLSRILTHCSRNGADPTCNRREIAIGPTSRDIPIISADRRLCSVALADPFLSAFSDEELVSSLQVPLQVHLPASEDVLLSRFHGARLEKLSGSASLASTPTIEAFRYPKIGHFAWLSKFPDEIPIPNSIRDSEAAKPVNFMDIFHDRLLRFFASTFAVCEPNRPPP